jgi:hypothetical protein
VHKALILGSSPFVNGIQDFSFIAKYPLSIAINIFDKCKTTHRCAFDANCLVGIKGKRLNGKLIINAKSYNSLQALSLLKKEPFFELENICYQFEHSQRMILEECGKLYGHLSSAIPAINYAILQGAKEIYLIGVDFNWNKGHYYSPKKFEKTEEQLLELRRNIKTLRNYADIYRTNPEDSLLLGFLPYKNIEEL